MTVVKLPQPAPVRADGGVDWGGAGIGAGTLFGVIAHGLGGAMAIMHPTPIEAVAGGRDLLVPLLAT